jgi:hypothetical protein
MTTYKPNEDDVRWAQNVVAMIKDGGMLAYPAAGCAYRLHHNNKVMELVNPDVLDLPESAETHERSIVVFAHLGWTVKVAA